MAFSSLLNSQTSLLAGSSSINSSRNLDGLEGEILYLEGRCDSLETCRLLLPMLQAYDNLTLQAISDNSSNKLLKTLVKKAIKIKENPTQQQNTVLNRSCSLKEVIAVNDQTKEFLLNKEEIALKNFKFTRHALLLRETYQSPYFENAKNASEWFRIWWHSAKDNKITGQNWEKMSRRLHRMITGAEQNESYNLKGDVGDSKKNAGIFRDEISLSDNLVSNADGFVLPFLFSWMDSFKLEYQLKPTNLISELFPQKGTKISGSIYWDQNKIQYVHALYLEELRLAAVHAINRIRLHKKMREQLPRNVFEERLILLLADYIHLLANGHLFVRTNLSHFMLQANVILEYYDLLPLWHGNLDFLALSLDFGSFRRVFQDFVVISNSTISVDLNSFVFE